MVRIINKHNIGIITNVLYSILRLQEKHTYIKELNNPDLRPCIYALWHANQFMVHGLPNRSNTSVLISNSIDGEIVSRINEKWGFKSIRGSSGKKGAVESTMQMISRLKSGESVVVMVDGPHGPLHKVKNGAIKLAQKTGVPIVPATWFSPEKTFISFPSWDKIKLPVGNCHILSIYGTPVYISQDAGEDEITAKKEEIKKQLESLDEQIPKLYEEALKNNLWNN